MPDFTPPTSGFAKPSSSTVWFDRNTFPDTYGFTTYLTGGIVNNAVRLATSGTMGNIYFSRPTSWNRNFSVYWRMNIGGGSGADGQCIQWVAAMGSGGGGGGCGRIDSAALAITFPTYGSQRLCKYADYTETQLLSGQNWRGDYYYWVDYLASSGKVSIYQSSTSTKPSSPIAVTNYTFDSGTYYIGLGAAVGGSWDNHDLKEWRLQIEDTVTDSLNDPYYSNMSLLLRMEGSNGGTSFTDSSPNAVTLTTAGTAQISTSKSKVGSSSGYFNNGGAGGTAKITGTTAGVNFGSGDFTIEAWIYPTSVYNYEKIITTRPDNGGYADAFDLGFQGDSSLYLFSNAYDVSGTGVVANAWQHVAVCRKGTTLLLFLNGALIGSNLSYSKTPTRTLFGVGQFPSSNQEAFSGYIDELKVIKGYAKYQNAFTLPTSSGDPYYSSTVFQCNFDRPDGSTSFVDDSASSILVTSNGAAQASASQYKYNASLSLDGAGSYLSVADHVSLDMSGDFTIEAWVYPTDFSQASGSNRCILSFASTTVDGARPAILLDSSGKLIWQGATALITSPESLSLNAWTHIAFVRSGTNLLMFTNGNWTGSATYSTAITPDQILIGRSTNTTGDYAGYIDDLRITKGVARYSMRGFLLSTVSSPAHSLTGFTGPSFVTGSDIAACTPYPVFGYTLYPALALGTSMSLQAGSDIGAAAPYAPTEGTGIDGTKVSLGSSGGTGSGPAVPTTGQIFPRGNS